MPTIGITRREFARPAAVPANPSRDGHWTFLHQRALRELPQMNGFTVLDHRVLDALVTCADRDGRARPGYRRIAAACGHAPFGRTSKSIDELERRGLIRRDRGDRSHASRYHLWPFVGSAGVRDNSWVGCGTAVSRVTPMNRTSMERKRTTGAQQLREPSNDPADEVYR